MSLKQSLFDSKFSVVLLLFVLIVLIAGALLINHQLRSSPQKTWALLLDAMQDSDVQQIEKLTTPEGLNTLKNGQDESKYLSDWHRWAEAWSGLDIRWQKIDDNTMLARVGNEMKEIGFVFKEGADGWKLDAVLPGH